MKVFLCFIFLLLTPKLFCERLVIFNWTEYLPSEVIQDFEKETGIEVKLSSYESNEAMYTKLKILRSKGYDLVIPSTYFVEKMIKEGMLQKLDHEQLPNKRHLLSRLTGLPFDVKNDFSIPYLWGTTVLSYNSEKIKEAPDSWKVLWKSDYKNQVLVLEDMRETFSVALKSLGYSSNSTSPAEIRKAYEKLLKLKENVRLFSSEAPKQAFINQEVTLGMTMSGDLKVIQEENPKIEAIYPKEGFTIWLDSMVIPKGASNPQAAHRFINYVLRSEVSLKIALELGYSTVNKESLNLEAAVEMKDNPLMNPSEEVLQRGEFLKDVGRSLLVYEDLWQRLKVE